MSRTTYRTAKSPTRTFLTNGCACIQGACHMSSQPVSGAFARSALLLAGLQAVVLWLCHHALEKDPWPEIDRSVFGTIYLVFVFVPLTLLLLWTHRTRVTLWVSAGAIGLFLVGAGWRAFSGGSPGLETGPIEDDRVLNFLAAWIPAWRTCLTLLEALLFTGVFWLLILLCGMLFQTLGIESVRTVINDPLFIYPAWTLAFATATQIIGASDRFIDGVLDQLFGLLKWLLPLAVLIVTAFTAVLIPKLPTLLNSGERVIDSWVLIALIAMTLLLFNAALREGERDPGYGPWLKRALRLAPPLLVIVAVTAFYSLSVRVTDLGLTPPRFWGLFVATFALIYSLGYAWASLKESPWMDGVRRINPLVSLLAATSLLLSLTPVADPLRLSIASQLERAMRSSSPEAVDGALRFLRFSAGAPGRDALDTLVQGTARGIAPEQIEALRQEAERIAALETDQRDPVAEPEATPARYRAWKERMRIIPQDAEIDPSLEAAISEAFMLSASMLDPPEPASAPQLVFVDLDGDNLAEALLLTGSLQGEPRHLRDYTIFRLADGVWTRWSSGPWL
jgi:hypothetical protein